MGEDGASLNQKESFMLLRKEKGLLAKAVPVLSILQALNNHCTSPPPAAAEESTAADEKVPEEEEKVPEEEEKVPEEEEKVPEVDEEEKAEDPQEGVEPKKIASYALGLLLALTGTMEGKCQKVILKQPVAPGVSATTVITQVMTIFSDSVNIQVHGLGLMANMSTLGKASIKTMLQVGVVPLILQDMRAWPDVDFVQRHGCKTMANMIESVKKSTKVEVKSNKGLSAMGYVLETFPKESATFAEAKRGMSFFI